MKQRDWYLAQMESAFKEGLIETAKKCGDQAKWLSERIKSHDYSKADSAEKLTKKLT